MIRNIYFFFKSLLRKAHHSMPIKTFYKGLYKKSNKSSKSPSDNYSIDELHEFICNMGVKEGDSIYLTTTWDNFNNFQGKVTDLFNIILNIIGQEGTLSMPSNTDMFLGGHFDERKTITNAGFASEIFRRMKGVKRSISLSSSVCSIGKKASFYTESHQDSTIDWDKYSPYFKMYEDNTKILSMGNGRFFTMGSPFHVSDYILFEKKIKYFKKIFKNKIKYTWTKKDGTSGASEIYVRDAVCNLPNFNRYIQHIPHLNLSISNLDCYIVKTKDLVDESVKLALDGKVIYEDPVPFKFNFKITN